MGKLVVDGNKVYTVDEACMRRKNLTLAQVRDAESGRKENSGEKPALYHRLSDSAGKSRVEADETGNSQSGDPGHF